MRVAKGDYIIAKEQKRDYLARALEDSTGDVEAVLEKMCHIPGHRLTLTVAKKDLVLNLGQTPQHGKVYGLDVTNLYYTKKMHNHFGMVYFFYKPRKEVVKDLWAAMDKTYVILKKRGLEFLLEDIIWEVMPYHKEKYAGMFIRSKNPKIPDRIQIWPEIMPANLYIYVLLHEIGHNMHLNFATGKKLNALWLRLFNTSIRVASVKKEVSASLLESLMSQEDPPSAFKSSLGEEEALAYKWIIRTIQSVNALSIKDLDTLFEADMRGDIRSVWPLRTIPRKELAPIISEYATKNVKETIAESFAFVLTGKKLPEPIVKLLERTISYAKANREKSDD